MSSRSVDLAIKMATEVGGAVAGFDDVSDAAKNADRAVGDAGDTAAKSARKIRVSADAADDLGGKAGKATGALGALSSGFELVGADKYAVGLQSAAMATDFFSGIGDGLNVVMESTIVKTTAAKVATIAQGVAAKATAVATKAYAAAQWALNAAMEANPIGLIVVALVALVAGIVLAYKKSETFRELVRKVGQVGRQAIGWIVDRVKDLLTSIGHVVDWVKGRLAPAFKAAGGLIKGYVRAYITVIKSVVSAVQSVVHWVSDKLPPAFRTARDAIKRVGSALWSPFQKVYDLVKKIVDWVKKIHVPHISNPFGGGGGAGTGGSNPTGGGGSWRIAAGATNGRVNNYQITINGAVDKNGTARQLRQILNGNTRLFGGAV